MEQAKQKRRYRKLQQFLKFENYLLMNALAVAEEKPLLVRCVAIKFRNTGKYNAYLSRFAVNETKFFDHLEEANFPYVTELGHFYLIKKASEEEIQSFLVDRNEKLTEFLGELKRKRGKT